MAVQLPRERYTARFLDISDVGSAAVHVGGAGVAEKVASAGFVDATALHELLDPITTFCLSL
jgi:hypothetical protein